MEIQRYALLRVIKAARLSMNVSRTMKALLVDVKDRTWADEMEGFLTDAIYSMIGENLSPDQDFKKDSITMRLLTGDLSDAAVTDWILLKDRLNRRINGEEEVQQPKPRFFTEEETKRMYEQNGGYQFDSPEGG